MEIFFKIENLKNYVVNIRVAIETPVKTNSEVGWQSNRVELSNVYWKQKKNVIKYVNSHKKRNTKDFEMKTSFRWKSGKSCQGPDQIANSKLQI